MDDMKTFQSRVDMRITLWIVTAIWIAMQTVSLLAAEPKIRVHCPAISHDNDDRNKSVPEGPRSVVVIAVGVVRLNPETRDEELLVERTLFGPRWKTIPLTNVLESRANSRRRSPEAPSIYCLTYPEKPSRFELTVDGFFSDVRVFPLQEESAVAAMAQARMDFLTLGSDSIFVGHPAVTLETQASESKTNDVQYESHRRHGNVVSVKVERLLSDCGPAVGSTVYVDVDDRFKHTGKSSIYFADEERRKSDVVYVARAQWPDTDTNVVIESLRRRELFPLKEQTDAGGNVERWREITFQGNADEAIKLLGSDYDAAQTLAARRLIIDRQTAVASVVSSIETNLLSAKLDQSDSFGRQERLIKLLAIQEDHRSDGHVVRLIDQMLTRIEQGAVYPQAKQSDNDDVDRFGRWSNRLETNANHSLVWLLHTLDEPDAAKLFGERLIKLRSHTDPGWEREIGTALDLGHLEDRLELSSLSERMKTLKPRRWQAGFRSDGLSHYMLACSPDGRYVAASGNEVGRVWSTVDWKVVGEFSPSGSIHSVTFSPDGQFIYSAGGGSISVFEKHDWKSGQLVRRFRGHDSAVNAMSLSQDGKFLLSSSFGLDQKTTLISDAVSGEIVERDDGSHWSQLRWHPEGSWFLGQRQRGKWFRVDLKKKQTDQVEIEIIDAVFSSDGRKIYSLEGKTDDRLGLFRSSDTPVTQSLRRRNSKTLEIEAERPIEGPFEWLVFINRNTQLAVCGFNTVEVVSADSFQTASRSPLADRKRDMLHDGNAQPTISPDGAWVGYPQTYGPPELFDLKTGQRLSLGAAHSARVTRVSFVNSNRQLQTVGSDHVTCVWDIDAGSLVERSGSPTAASDLRNDELELRHRSEDGSLVYLFKPVDRYSRYAPPTAFTVEIRAPRNSDESDQNEDESEDEPDDRHEPAAKDTPGVHRSGKIQLKWGQYKPIGLVPDKAHFFVGTHIFRRDDLELVSATNVCGDVEQINFSGSGERYVVVTSERIERPGPLAGVTMMELVIDRVRVHHSQTGRTLFAVEIPSPGVTCVALNKTGSQLAVVTSENEIQLWNVP